MTNLNLDALQSAELLRPQSGDIVVLHHPSRLPLEATQRLRKAFKDFLPEKVRIMVLDEGTDIKLLRPENAEQYVVEGGKE